LKTTYQYLEENWTEKELKKLSLEIERTIKLISDNPKIFSVSDKMKVRRAIIKNLNTLYYKEMKGNRIEILSFFSNRQNPNK